MKDKKCEIIPIICLNNLQWPVVTEATRLAWANSLRCILRQPYSRRFHFSLAFLCSWCKYFKCMSSMSPRYNFTGNPTIWQLKSYRILFMLLFPVMRHCSQIIHQGLPDLYLNHRWCLDHCIPFESPVVFYCSMSYLTSIQRMLIARYMQSLREQLCSFLTNPVQIQWVQGIVNCLYCCKYYIKARTHSCKFKHTLLKQMFVPIISVCHRWTVLLRNRYYVYLLAIVVISATYFHCLGYESQH